MWCVDGVCVDSIVEGVCGSCLQSGRISSEEHPAGATAEEESGGRLEQQLHRAGASLRRKLSSLTHWKQPEAECWCWSHFLLGSL